MDILCRVTESGLMPLYGSDLDEKKKLKVGTEVLATVRKARNYRFHKKFFALLKLCLDNMPDQRAFDWNIWSVEDLKFALKLDLGYARVENLCGRMVVREKSLAFDRMDESEFERFYKDAVNVVCKKYLRGVDSTLLEEEIINFM